MTSRLANDPSFAGIGVTLTIHKASGLVAKDRSLFRKKKSSDPYIKVYYDGLPLGKTKVQKKTLEPVWQKSFKHLVGIDDSERIRRAVPGASRDAARGSPCFVLLLFDHDMASADDPSKYFLVDLESQPTGYRLKYIYCSGGGDRPLDDGGDRGAVVQGGHQRPQSRPLLQGRHRGGLCVGADGPAAPARLR